MVYLCSGEDSEKLEWFRTINIAGKELSRQELRNAIYHGSWVTDAKRYFSKRICPGGEIGKKHLTGAVNRSDYLETAIKWISYNNIEKYMSKYQKKPNAIELWKYFVNVINWVNMVFPTYYKEMKGVSWGFLYNEFKNQKLDSEALDKEISKLMLDDDVQNRKGIFLYVLFRKENHLDLRLFDVNQKRKTYEKQKGICVKCANHFEIDDMEGDHIIPWHKGGRTTPDNCQMLCKDDNRRKSGR